MSQATLIENLGVNLAEAILRTPKEERPHWASCEDAVQQAVISYEMFFELLVQYPEKELVPTEIQDYVWHKHMLHPRAYSEVCMRRAGRVIDHDGGFGHGAGELEQLARAFDETKSLWREHFGVQHPAEESAALGASCKSWCKGTTCRKP